MPELNGWKIIKNIIDPSIRSNPEDVSFSHILLIIKNITDLLLWAAGIAALFMILWGGIQYITAYGDEDTKAQILDCGADEYLSKPFELDKFMECVNNLPGTLK